MNKKNDTIGLDEIENFMLYIGIGGILLLDFVQNFIPSVDKFLGDTNSLSILALLIILRVLIKKMTALEETLEIGG